MVKPIARRIDRPSEPGLRRNAEVKAEALNACNVRLDRSTGVAAEDALQFRRRANHVADILTAFAFEDAGLNLLLARAPAIDATSVTAATAI